MKKILFRVDGNTVIGAGHIMRCLSIGMAARAAGAECGYLIADHSFEALIKKEGFWVYVLESDYSRMDDELVDLISIITDYDPDITLIDSYYVTAKYINTIREKTYVAYIDDTISFAYPVNILINYNIYAEDLKYSDLYIKAGIKTPQLILGKAFVPLRQEFQNLSEISVKQNVENILFSAGGADPEHMILAFVNTIIDSNIIDHYNFHLILGNFEPDLDEIVELSKKYSNIYPHKNVTCMAQLMRQCDIAVSAAGSTLYELCACGIPTITYSLEDNQIPGAQTFSKKNMMINIGDIRLNNMFMNDLLMSLSELCIDYGRRQKMHLSVLNAVDGHGAKRIANELLKF